MLLSLNDPESILNWWKVWPQRHDAFLDHALKASPQFAHAIREAQRRIVNSPELSSMLAGSVREHRDRVAASAHQDSNLSAQALRLSELA